MDATPPGHRAVEVPCQRNPRDSARARRPGRPKALAEVLAYALERVTALLAEARAGAPGRAALALPEPSPRISEAFESRGTPFERPLHQGARLHSTTCSRQQIPRCQAKMPSTTWSAEYCSRCSSSAAPGNRLKPVTTTDPTAAPRDPGAGLRIRVDSEVPVCGVIATQS